MSLNIEKVFWKSGAAVPADTDPNACWNEVEAIRKKAGGSVDPEDVVKRAKGKRNVLHPLFEWDDSKAAHAHRVECARGLMRSFHVVYKEHPAVETRLYESVTVVSPSKGDRGRRVYEPVAEILADPDKRSSLMDEAMRDLATFRRKYRVLQELAIIHRNIDELLLQYKP